MTDHDEALNPKLTALILAVIVVVVGAIQLRWALDPWYGYDEAWHAFEARIAPAWKAFLVMAGDSHPFLYYLMLRPFAWLGTEPVYLRLLSIISALLTIPLWYGLLRKLRISTVVALTATVALAASFSFNNMGIMVRSYAVTLFLLLAAIWFWVDLLPNTRGRPSRRSLIISLALFSTALFCLYAAAFVTAAVFGATLAIMALDGDTRRIVTANFRRCSRWPEWTLFAASYLLAGLWHWVGWIRHINAAPPNHVAQFTLADGQPLSEFLVDAIRNQIDLLTPLLGLEPMLLDAGGLALLLLIVWLTVRFLRANAPALAAAALIPLVLTATLAFLAVVQKYPFGGHLRHQYILFPFLLMLVPLAMQAVWGWLPNRILKGILIVVVIGGTAVTAVRTYDARGFIGDAAAAVRLKDEYATLFAGAGEDPVLIPGFTLFPTFIDRIEQGWSYRSSYREDAAGYFTDYQGWLSIALPWSAYQEYGSHTDDGREIVVVKDHYRWLFDPVPDELFFTQLGGLLTAMGENGVRVFAPRFDDSIAQDEPALREAAAAHGFRLTSFEPIKDGAIWILERNTPAAAPPTGVGACP